MRLSKCSVAPRIGRAAIPLASLLALALAGCATGSEYQQASWYDGQQVLLEDDGLPPQAPPLRRTKDGPDDPSEPFSPNYGPPLPGEEMSPAGPTLPADLPPAFRRQLARAIAI